MKICSGQAIDFMIEKTGMERKGAEDEVDRYCFIPGQACAYKVRSMINLTHLFSKLKYSTIPVLSIHYLFC